MFLTPWEQARKELIEKIAKVRGKSTEEIEKDIESLVNKVKEKLDDRPSDKLE